MITVVVLRRAVSEGGAREHKGSTGAKHHGHSGGKPELATLYPAIATHLIDNNLLIPRLLHYDLAPNAADFNHVLTFTLYM